MAKNPEIQRIRRALRKKGSAFARYAPGFYRIQKATGIDGLYWASLAMQESGPDGQYTPSNAKHNYFGWRVYTGQQHASGNTTPYANAPSAFTYMASQFAKSPYAKAKSVFDPVWDPYAADPNHEAKIANIYRTLGGNPQNIRVNGTHGDFPSPGIGTSPGAKRGKATNFGSGNKPKLLRKMMAKIVENNNLLLSGGMPDTAGLIGIYNKYNQADNPRISPNGNRHSTVGGPNNRNTPVFGGNILGGKWQMGGGPGAHGSRPLGNWQSDHAWDLMAPAGTPVYAAFGGVVDPNAGFGFSSNGSTVWGRRLTISGGGNSAFYTHLGKYAKGVKPGKKIKKGQLIGWLGDPPGFEPHLHIGLQHGNLVTSW